MPFVSQGGPGGPQSSNISLNDNGEGFQLSGFYTPVTPHWFYSSRMELRTIWKPFSFNDSSRLEEAFRSGKIFSFMVCNTVTSG